MVILEVAGSQMDIRTSVQIEVFFIHLIFQRCGESKLSPDKMIKTVLSTLKPKKKKKSVENFNPIQNCL